jgi:hypothetical protein
MEALLGLMKLHKVTIFSRFDSESGSDSLVARPSHHRPPLRRQHS